MKENRVFFLLILILILISFYFNHSYFFNTSKKLDKIGREIDSLKEIVKSPPPSSSSPPPLPELKIGEKAPLFEMNSTKGKKYSLSDYFGKKNVILLAWILSCPHCREVVKKFNSFYKNLDEKKVELLSVTRVISEEDKNQIVKFIESEKIKFPVLLSADEKFGIDYKITSVPIVWVINREGEISRIHKSEELKGKEFGELFKEFLK
jgi:peroxiredoxin